MIMELDNFCMYSGTCLFGISVSLNLARLYNVIGKIFQSLAVCL